MQRPQNCPCLLFVLLVEDIGVAAPSSSSLLSSSPSLHLPGVCLWHRLSSPLHAVRAYVCVCVSVAAASSHCLLSASAAELSQHASICSPSLVFSTTCLFLSSRISFLFLSLLKKGVSTHLQDSCGCRESGGGRDGAVTSRHFGVLRTAVNRRRAPDGIGAVKPTSLTAD